jgi:hypothetical protein
MDVTTLQDLRNHLENWLENKLQYFDRRLSTVEEIQKGSVNSKGERIRSEVQMEAAINSLEDRMTTAESARRELTRTVVQGGTTLFIAFVLAAAAFLFELYRNTK